MAIMTAITPAIPLTEPDFSGTGTVLNPATGAAAGEVQWTDPADVPTIAAGLRAAQREWEQRGAKGRAKALARYAVWLADHRGEIEELLIKETGKYAVDAAQEVPLLIMILSYYIKTMEKEIKPERRPAALPFLAIKKITVYYRPRPVVGIIAPWNYPVANALMDGLDALAAGCAVLLKPSERTQLTAEVLRRGRRRQRRLRPVHRLGRRRKEGDGARRPPVDAGQPGTRRQGPDDRSRGRRRRPRRPRRGVGSDVQRGADLRLSGAGLRARAGVRPVRRGGGSRRQEAAGRCWRGTRLRGVDRRAAAVGDRASRPRGGGRRCESIDRWPAHQHVGQLLPAHRARRRGPLDGLHDRGDLRPHTADHEGRFGRGGDPAGQRQRIRPERLGVLP